MVCICFFLTLIKAQIGELVNEREVNEKAKSITEANEKCVVKRPW